MRKTTLCVLTLVGLGLLWAVDRDADGCGMAFSRIAPVRVAIADESAIIIWDEANKTEHFIRRSNYKTTARDFGFLVPTPTQPELAEAKDQAFKMLERLTAPVILPPPPGGPRFPGAPAGGKVEVLEIKRVAGFIAAVLKATDADALNDWLKKNDYQSRPELTTWLEPYIKSGWIITAFKIASDEPKSSSIATAAVRMSFKTERPFYPYREPADARVVTEGSVAPARLLRVYVLTKDRVQANVGKDGQFPGKTVWANTITANSSKALAKHLKLEAWQPGEGWWLTEMEDRSSPRPGTDEVYFSTSTDQSTVARPPVQRFGPPRLPVPAPLPAPK